MSFSLKSPKPSTSKDFNLDNQAKRRKCTDEADNEIDKYHNKNGTKCLIGKIHPSKVI